MFIRTATDLGAIIRERRRQRRIGQAELARTIGVGRQWVVAIERGQPGAEIGLVLRALDSLGIRLDTKTGSDADAPPPAVDIDAIVASSRKADR